MPNNTPNIPFYKRWFDSLAGTPAGKQYMSDRAAASAKAAGLNFEDPTVISNVIENLSQSPLKTKIPVAEGVEHTMSPLGATGGLIWENVKAHPYKTGLTGLNAAANVAGLVNDDKILGQALGAIGGAVLGKAIGPAAGWGKLGVANAAMLGGNLGSLFDALRSKREQEQQYQEQYY